MQQVPDLPLQPAGRGPGHAGAAQPLVDNQRWNQHQRSTSYAVAFEVQPRHLSQPHAQQKAQPPPPPPPQQRFQQGYHQYFKQQEQRQFSPPRRLSPPRRQPQPPQPQPQPQPLRAPPSLQQLEFHLAQASLAEHHYENRARLVQQHPTSTTPSTITTAMPLSYGSMPTAQSAMVSSAGVFAPPGVPPGLLSARALAPPAVANPGSSASAAAEAPLSPMSPPHFLERGMSWFCPAIIEDEQQEEISAQAAWNLQAQQQSPPPQMQT